MALWKGLVEKIAPSHAAKKQRAKRGAVDRNRAFHVMLLVMLNILLKVTHPSTSKRETFGGHLELHYHFLSEPPKVSCSSNCIKCI